MIRIDTVWHGSTAVCDKCKKAFTADDPGADIYQSSREGKNIILIHYVCLEKLVAKAKQEGVKVDSPESVANPQEINTEKVGA